MWSVQIIARLPYFTSDQQEKEAVHAWLVRQLKAQKLWPGILSALKIRLILWKNYAVYRPKKKCYVVFRQYIPDILTHPHYVKKLNYPSIWLKKFIVIMQFTCCLLQN
jgi:hypothetical protein